MQYITSESDQSEFNKTETIIHATPTSAESLLGFLSIVFAINNAVAIESIDVQVNASLDTFLLVSSLSFTTKKNTNYLSLLY